MRVVTVLGPSQSGKTELTAALAGLDASQTGRMEASGGVAALQVFSYLEDDWAAIDIAGGSDNIAQAGPALAASDAAVLCVPPEADAAVLCAPYLRLIEEAEIPCFLFINRMDQATERVRDVVAALQSFSQHSIVLRQVPMRDGGTVVGAVDLISERAWRYQDGQPSALIEMPEEIKPRESEARSELLDSLADFDDALLEQLIDDQEPLTGDLYQTATEVLRSNSVIPCFLGSAANGNGVTRLMKSLRHEAPEYEVARERLGGDALAVSCLADSAKHLGKFVVLRALGDGVASGSHLGGQNVSTMTAIDAKTPQPSLSAGSIGLILKTDHISVGEILGAETSEPLPEWAGARPPVLKQIVRPVRERDEARLSSALGRMGEVDPGLTVGHDDRSGETLLGLQGQQHCRRVVERLADEFGIETELANVVPAFRETITKETTLHHRHRKQSGGAGQFADVVMKIRPRPRGEGHHFDEEVKGGAVPRKFIPAVETGAREALEEGPGGFPVVDVAITLMDGKHHAVDSSEFAFRTAGRNGVREALTSLSTQALQPINSVHIHIPSVFVGALVPVISSLSGQVLGFDSHPEAKGWDVFNALLPAAAEEDLARSLGRLSRGTGWYESSFDHYEPCRFEDTTAATEDARVHA
ncbi:MAG: elongation factor G [Pseudomonadota bacterium]